MRSVLAFAQHAAHAIESAANGLASTLGGRSTGSALPRALLETLGRSLSAVVKLTGGLLSSLLVLQATLVRVTFGGFMQPTQARRDLARALSLLWDDLVGATAILLVRSIELIQVALRVGVARPLREREWEVLSRVFEAGLTLKNMRVVEGHAGVFSWANDRPFTVGNVIYLKGRVGDALLVHEALHVWQYQHFGLTYVGNSLRHQFLILGDYNAYAFQRHVQSDLAWEDWPSAEAQAAFIEDLWRSGRCPGRNREGSFFTPTAAPGVREHAWLAAANHATCVIRMAAPKVWPFSGYQRTGS